MSTLALPFAEADAFVAELAELPFARWPTPATTAEYTTAVAVLDAVLADRRLDVPAWYVRDLVETSASIARCRADAPPSVARRARALAEHAALALLVRPLLPACDFGALYAPFARVLP